MPHKSAEWGISFLYSGLERAKRPATANGKEELFCPMPNAQYLI
ncbi:MAG: hypothetical protein V7L23_04170 [Nostoc sp.]